jgi:H+-transporting ATPase
MPGKWLLIGSSLDILVVGTLATQGILMTPIPFKLVAEVLSVIVVYIVLLDLVKVPIFARLNLN